ncbi:hypothetical protein NUH16_011131 [Penicillium rubens]|nr:hypothetical protein NUH16_011131 [Penicillium rubens]
MREFDRVEFVNRHDDIQNTPLDYAITTSSSTIVNMLISAGARIDNTDRLGYTPLMNACHLGRDEIVHCLVDRGADIQATNNFNLSALECIMTGESRTKKTLLQRICPHATQLQLNRALWLATNDKKEFVGILLKFGADGQYAGNLEEDGSYDAERNTDPSATTPRPVEASTPLSRRHLSPSIATGVTSREDRYIIWKHRNESQAPHARRWLAPFPWNFARNVEMSDAEPDITNESTSDDTAGAQTRGMNDSSVGPQLFVDFEKLNISEGRPEKKGRHEDPQPGDIAGFGGTGKSRFFIFRVGPAQAPRHVFRRTRAYSTEGFENLSHNRISLLRYNAPNGDRHWQYTRRNIAGFRGIAIDETESNLKCPQTWINVEWKDIKEEHRYLLVDECSWTPRTDVIRLSGRKVASTGIRAMWTLQETLHIKAIQKEGKLVSPLPFPLAAFEADKIKPERSRTPAQLRSFSSTTKSRSSTSRDNMADGIKQEQEQETSTVVPSRSATQDDPGSNVVEVESSGSSQSKNQAPKKFNVQAYMASVEKMEKWNAMSEAEREKRYRIALANYDHYREERLNKGDVEVEDEL